MGDSFISCPSCGAKIAVAVKEVQAELPLVYPCTRVPASFEERVLEYPCKGNENSESTSSSKCEPLAISSSEEDFIKTLRQILGDHEMSEHGGLWRTRYRECRSALHWAIEEWNAGTPDQRRSIRNRPAWLTNKFYRARSEIMKARRSAWKIARKFHLPIERRPFTPSKETLTAANHTFARIVKCGTSENRWTVTGDNAWRPAKRKSEFPKSGKKKGGEIKMKQATFIIETELDETTLDSELSNQQGPFWKAIQSSVYPAFRTLDAIKEIKSAKCALVPLAELTEGFHGKTINLPPVGARAVA
jgi:hypothetical protein